MVAEQLGVLDRLPLHERRRYVQTERLLKHRPEVAQLTEVILGNLAVAAAMDGRAHLKLELAHLVRMGDELRHCPFHNGGGRIRAAYEHVLHHTHICMAL